MIRREYRRSEVLALKPSSEFLVAQKVKTAPKCRVGNTRIRTGDGRNLRPDPNGAGGRSAKGIRSLHRYRQAVFEIRVRPEDAGIRIKRDALREFCGFGDLHSESVALGILEERIEISSDPAGRIAEDRRQPFMSRPRTDKLGRGIGANPHHHFERIGKSVAVRRGNRELKGFRHRRRAVDAACAGIKGQPAVIGQPVNPEGQIVAVRILDVILEFKRIIAPDHNARSSVRYSLRGLIAANREIEGVLHRSILAVRSSDRH